MGASHVALAVHWSQRDVYANVLAADAGTIPDNILRLAIRKARRAGLKVMVFPLVQLGKTRRGDWRGTLRPARIDRWWLSYEAFVLHYARIAADEQAEVLSIGSELGTTEPWRDRWYHLISRIEKIYRGALVYSANWDHFEMVSFWRRLDYLGVTGYFELTRDRDASTAELTKAWVTARGRLLAFRKRRGVRLWITEVGYTSQDGAAIHPWDYTGTTRIDLEEQRRCYAAFRDAWDGVPELGGVFFWNWYGAGGHSDRGYTPKGKPAEKILRAWWGRI